MSALEASFFSRSTIFSLPGDTISVGANVRFSSSTPMSFFGRSMMWPIEASTWYSLPRYLLIVFAFAGDSTITSDLPIRSLHPPERTTEAERSINLRRSLANLTRFRRIRHLLTILQLTKFIPEGHSHQQESTHV